MKNDHLGFTIPYTLNGERKNYVPDFIVHLDDGRDDPLQLVVEGSGRIDLKEAKASTAETLWIPAVNNAGEWGRWAYVEITDPWDAANRIREKMKRPEGATV